MTPHTLTQPSSPTPATTREHHALHWLTHPAHPLTSHTSQQYPPIPLWEWATTRDQHGASTGITHTRHGAIHALTTALTHTGRPRTGHITPILLTDPTHDTTSCYLRGHPHTTATYDGKAIQWT